MIYLFLLFLFIAAVMFLNLWQTRLYDKANNSPAEPRDPWLLLVAVVLGTVGIVGAVVQFWPKV